jgi:uncharacterized protein YeaO (DUF488 family)
MGKMNIKLKRVYEDADSSDGIRILVERLWPRGVTKAAAAIDHWFKDIAPSPELRKWFDHRPERWSEFQKRYREELTQNQQRVADLRALCLKRQVTFIFAARDTARNGAVVLKKYLES